MAELGGAEADKQADTSGCQRQQDLPRSREEAEWRRRKGGRRTDSGSAAAKQFDPRAKCVEGHMF